MTATGHEEFDRRFQVKAQHPELAKTLLGPVLVAEHLAGRAPAWSITGDTLLAW